jgi:asparagine synthase (glutamine-hydrolysing)
MLHVDLRVVLADNNLRKVNRMCALAGVRVRFPFLDERVVELSARVPPNLLIRGLQLRYFFRLAVGNYLPQKVLKKRKHGFGLPYRPWLKEWAPLRELAYEGLASLKQRGYLRGAYIEGIREQHGNDDSPGLADRLWDLMMLELWMRHHVGPWKATKRAN